MLWTVIALSAASGAAYGMLTLLGHLQSEKWSTSRCILFTPKNKYQGRTITPRILYSVILDPAAWSTVLARRVESKQGEWRVDGLICNLMWQEQDKKLVYSFRNEEGTLALEWTWTLFERDAHPFPAHIPIPLNSDTGGCFCQLKEEGYAKKPFQRLSRWYRGDEANVEDALWNLTTHLLGPASMPIFVSDGTKKAR